MRESIKLIWKYIALELVFDVICTILSAFMPVLQKQLFDVGIAAGVHTVISIIAIYIVIQLLHTLFEYLCMIVTWKGAITFEMSLKQKFFRAVFQMDHERFREKPVAEYISMQGNDITALEQDYLQPLVDVIRSVNMLVIYGVVMYLYVDKRIMFTIFVTSLVAVIGPKLTGKMIAKRRECYQKQIAKYMVKITDLLEGFSLINNQTRGNINDVHEQVLGETAEKRYAFGKGKTLALSVNQLSVKVIRIAAFISAGILLLQGKITIGTGVAVFGYVSSFLEPINSLLYDVNAIQSVQEVKKRFLSNVELMGNETKLEIAELKNGIDFEKVGVSVGNFQLKEISARFERGKKYAIIGHSGSGKSTLLKMMMGYLKPQCGTIEIDGQNLSEVDTASLITYIEQGEYIYRAGYQENVTIFGSYPIERIQRASKLSIKPLKAIEKNEENCQELSGGEKQALAFLRMLAKGTPVILLDEPFSALDVGARAVLEEYVLKSEEMKDKTLIMVTHDISEKLEQYDEVLLMEHGKLIACGKYDEIKEQIGEFCFP